MKYNDYLKNVKYYSREADKDRAFMNRLKGSYNKEIIIYDNEEFPCIIETGRIGTISETHYKISTLLEVGLTSGSIVKWKRLDKNYMVFFPRRTEKNYFIARIYEAQHKIAWVDKFGEKHRIDGVLKSFNDDINMLGIDGSFVDTIDGDMALYVPINSENIDFMKRNREVKIKGRNWKITGWDDFSYENIAKIGLVEVLSNQFTDTEELPGKENIPHEKVIQTNLDGISYMPLHTKTVLIMDSYVDEKKILEEYEITANNCSYENNLITFDTIGRASIYIIGKDTSAIKIYRIDVKADIDDEENFRIQGKKLIKNSVDYTYSIVGYKNGTEVNYANYSYEWIMPNNCKIKRISDREIFLSTNNIDTYQMTVLVSNLKHQLVQEITIEIESEDLL